MLAVVGWSATGGISSDSPLEEEGFSCWILKLPVLRVGGIGFLEEWKWVWGGPLASLTLSDAFPIAAIALIFSYLSYAASTKSLLLYELLCWEE